jgi:hypothetical protein
MATSKRRVRKSTTKVRAGKKGGDAASRHSYADEAKIKVVGEHTRREGSRYYKGFESMRTVRTVGAFRAKRPKDANELLRAASNDKYIQIAAR